MKRLDAPIRSVTVLEDRAQVTRRGTVQLEAGASRLRIEGVAPVLSDRTLVARVEGGAAKVVDARVERRLLEREEADAELRALEEELETGELEEAALGCERARAEARLEQLKALVALRLDDAAEDAAWGREPQGVDADVAAIRAEAREALREALALDRRRQGRSRHLKRLRRRIAERARRPSHRIGAALVLDVKAEQAGEVSLRIDYVVPAAAWRPYHRAVVAADRIVLETDACIWQNTGEDWEEVALALSTERLSLGVEAPELATDELRACRKRATVHVSARDQRVDKASVAGGAAPELPGIDDGGEPQVLRARGASRVPSDGRPHRVRLGSIEGPADIELWGRPELDAQVHRVAKLYNGSDRPLLAGPVDVIREGGASGRTKLAFVGPGERFELGLGPEPDLRLRRDTELKVDDARLLSSWTRTHHRVRVRISNLGSRALSVRIRERIPVSEIEQVKVVFHEATAGAAPDRDGFVDFERRLEPRGTDRIELSYQIDKHDSVVGL